MAYGPLVKEKILGQTIVWVFRPEDIAEVFKSEYGKIPARRSHLALYKYRTDRKTVYKTGGLLPTNGTEWLRIRREFQKSLSKPQEVLMYLKEINPIMEQFVEICKQKDYDDFHPLLSRLYLELIGLVAFDEKMNSFSKEEMQEDSTSSKLIDSAFVTNDAVLHLDGNLRLWRFFDTPLYKKMSKAQEFMESVAIDMVRIKKQKLKNFSKDRKLSLLETYLMNPNLDEKDVVGMACDMLLAGVDTTTNTTAWALYHLGRNLKVQEKLYQEAATLLPNKNDSITCDILKHANYTKAVLKETLRLNPISVGVGRILQTDVVLDGYQVPKGTNVVTQNQIICRSPEYFSDPDSFIPERWLRNGDSGGYKTEKPIHPYAVLPFGHGSRSCIARRLAEQNMLVFLLKICRNFQFTWQNGEIDCISLLINKPDAPIKLKFYQR
ncbi:cytochrome P450 302a1, mitochondrial isoform X2 [Leptopilina boulardi]|nr:cytochrome P450 302a1, mitochondrial isoform X2 [Leptopilina boulardi]XP_051158007.1 cytochrome P450 302a1, mitochondrial isoform X2 [Leptopilina boulardi]XP_051158008.1 cytochrome P450 302a1, mitochondrial isoform X2 [Leptopilina boulardi]